MTPAERKAMQDLIEACKRLILVLAIAGLHTDPWVAHAEAAIERAEKL